MKEFKTDELYEIAKIVDNDFIGKKETFSSDNRGDYFLLNTSQCDFASLIRVYHSGNKITRLGRYTDGWQDIHGKTMDRVEKYISILNKQDKSI